MKRVMVLSAMVLAILLSGAAIQAKGEGRVRATAGKAKGLTEEEKQWKEKLKAMTPEQRQVAMAQKALEKELAPWQEVRKIAVEEKAEKTVAAIDKVIAAKQAQLKKKLEAMAKRKAASVDKPKKEKAASADKPKKENRQGGEERRQKKPKTEDNEN
jgi:hypothetical protein